MATCASLDIDLLAPQPDLARSDLSADPASRLLPQAPHHTAVAQPPIASSTHTQTPPHCGCCCYRLCDCDFHSRFSSPPTVPFTSATSTVKDERQTRYDPERGLDYNIRWIEPSQASAFRNIEQDFRKGITKDCHPLTQTEWRKAQFRLRRWPTLSQSVSIEESDISCFDNDLKSKCEPCERSIDSHCIAPLRRFSVDFGRSFVNSVPLLSHKVNNTTCRSKEFAPSGRQTKLSGERSISCPDLSSLDYCVDESVSNLDSAYRDRYQYSWTSRREETEREKPRNGNSDITTKLNNYNAYLDFTSTSSKCDIHPLRVRDAVSREGLDVTENSLRYKTSLTDAFYDLVQDLSSVKNRNFETAEIYKYHGDKTGISYWYPYSFINTYAAVTADNDTSPEALDELMTNPSMQRSSSESRARRKTRFDMDVDYMSYPDKRHSDSEGSDFHTTGSRIRTNPNLLPRSNVTRKKPNAASSGVSGVPVRQKAVKTKQPRQPSTAETPGPQRKTQQRRILPTLSPSQIPAREGTVSRKNTAKKKPPVARSQTMSDIETSAESKVKPQDENEAPTQTGQTNVSNINVNGSADDVGLISNSGETSQRRSIMKVMRRPTEVSDTHIYTMKPSDVRLNKGVWTEAKQAEEEEEEKEREAEEGLISPTQVSEASTAPAVPPRPSVIPKPVQQVPDVPADVSESTEPQIVAYTVDKRPGVVKTSAVIHLSNTNLSKDDGSCAENDITNTNGPTENGDNITSAEAGIDNTSSDAKTPETPTTPDVDVMPSTPSKSQSEPLLNTDDTEAEKLNSSFRRPRGSTRSTLSGSDDLLANSANSARAYKNPAVSPGQTHPYLFPRSPAGSDGNSSGGSNTSGSLPPGVPWSRETYTSRKRYEMAHCEHEHFLSMNSYGNDLRLDKSPRSSWKPQPHEHHQCNHTNGSVDMEHFRMENHCNRNHGKGENSIGGPYLTPRQRLEKETRMLKRE
ncbi:hypothetical protein PoB_007269800, partial [Plakobranchus ocellatus]